MNFDIEGLRSLVWHYGAREGIITPDTWEKIICKSVGGTHVPGDVFMADGIKDKSGLNIKTLLKEFTKGYIQTCSYVQCRCPLDETSHIGNGIIKTLVDKREESFREFGLDQMMDVIVIHNRIGDDYNVRLFAKEQLKYENLDFEWQDGCGYLNPDKSKKNWKGGWKLKRNGGNQGGWQTCLYIKEVFDSKNCIVDFTEKCADEFDISIEDAKKRRADSLQTGTLIT